MRHVSSAAGRPTVLALHGRGADEGQLLPLLRAADRSCGVLAPRGEVPSSPGWAWCRRHCVGVPIPSDLRLRAERLGDHLEATLLAQGIGTPVPVVAYSNGAMMAVALAVVRPGLVGPMALLRGAYPLPGLGGGRVLAGLRVLASAGERDPLLSTGVFAAGVNRLRCLGAEVEPCVHAGLGHDLALADARTLRVWLGALSDLPTGATFAARPPRAGVAAG